MTVNSSLSPVAQQVAVGPHPAPTAAKKPVASRSKKKADATTAATTVAANSSTNSQSDLVDGVQPKRNSRKSESPFDDGYDIEAERVALADLLAQDDPSPNDPLYERYLQLLDRESALGKMKEHHRLRASGNPEVPLEQGMRVRQIGALEASEEDTMLIHTLEASRLYTGVSPEPGSGNRFGVPGARRAATALRQLFLLTGDDNPYADLRLIEIDARMSQARKIIGNIEKSLISGLDKKRARGLNYSILQSKKPMQFSLGYHSPYGYALSDLIVSFDYCVRVLKSATRRDVISKKEEHAALHTMKRELRSLFELSLEAVRFLMAKEVLGLCRTDYLPTATPTSKKRIATAKAQFGAVPQDVFVGQKSPRHTLRNERLTKAEISVLVTISQSEMEQATKDEGIGTPIDTNALV